MKGNADVGGPVVTYNGKYVIDGHHRWSQVYAANPDAKVPTIDIRGNLKPSEMLKVVHAAIAADRKSTRLNSSHIPLSRMPSSA